MFWTLQVVVTNSKSSTSAVNIICHEPSLRVGSVVNSRKLFFHRLICATAIEDWGRDLV